MKGHEPTYETVIGLEVHIQLATRSKIFCPDPTDFGAAPNTQVSPVSLAHPGTLPVPNREAVRSAIRLGLALGCTISSRSMFDRKSYFYADLPKGYQITQDRAPICLGGTVSLDPEGAKKVRIHHIHLEEDAGKSMHDQDPSDSLIDLNRAGVPLLELVTEPDLRSAADAAAFMEKIRRMVRWIGVSDGNMEEGSMRCDINVSVRPAGAAEFGQRCEIKNVNSMRFARRAIEYEAQRQIDVLKAGGAITQETRGFDAAKGSTYSLREKEYAHDYRYFPDPDLPPLHIETAYVDHIRETMPELPDALALRWIQTLGLGATDAGQLTQDRSTAQYFGQLLETAAERQPELAKPLANLIIHKLRPWCETSGCPLPDNPVPPENWIAFLELIENKQISASTAYQRLFPALLEQAERTPAELAHELNLLQESDTEALATLADAILSEFPDKVDAYRKGKKGLLGFFMGELMKRSRGKADPAAATKVLEEKLG